MPRSTPPRFVIRTLVATLATVAFVLSAVLLVVTLNVRANARAGVVDGLRTGQRLLAELEKRRARVETASELDSTTSSELVANLKKKYGSDLAAEFIVNPELLGGMRVRVGSDVWDGTVRNRLKQLERQL